MIHLVELLQTAARKRDYCALSYTALSELNPVKKAPGSLVKFSHVLKIGILRPSCYLRREKVHLS